MVGGVHGGGGGCLKDTNGLDKFSYILFYIDTFAWAAYVDKSLGLHYSTAQKVS